MPSASLIPSELIDLEHDLLRPVSEICRERTGKAASPAKVSRWRLKGCRGVRLAAVLCNGCWCTTDRAWAAFIRGQTEAAIKSSRCNTATTPTERDAAKTHRLQRAGLLQKPRRQ
jgi:hypothetical protein